MIERMHASLKKAAWVSSVKAAQCKSAFIKPDKRICVFDTSINTQNKGDEIIVFYTLNVLKNIFHEDDIKRISTHILPSADDIKSLPEYKYKFVSGTNLISPYYERFNNWKMPSDLYGYNDITSIGVGWGMYTENYSKTSKFVYNNILSKKHVNSVRDSYTEAKFRGMGIHNVINTGCPSLWNLTKEFCSYIPKEKSDDVITTITDYDKDPDNDTAMIDILLKNYKNVFVWIQGKEDLEYISRLNYIGKVNVLDISFQEYTLFLKNHSIDYVGTRLHGGIHAINCKKRSLIISIDNRAEEMGRDFNLPILKRSEIYNQLESIINGDLKTDISIPEENIRIWKDQFVKEKYVNS